jgi:hypothetical protein
MWDEVKNCKTKTGDREDPIAGLFSETESARPLNEFQE